MLILTIAVIIITGFALFFILLKQGQLFEINLRLENRLQQFTEQLDKLIVRTDERGQQSQYDYQQIRISQQEIQRELQQWQKVCLEQLNNYYLQSQQEINNFKQQLQADWFQQRQNFEQQQIQGFKLVQDSLQLNVTELRKQVIETLKHNTETLDKRVDKLTQEVNLRLREISGQVEKRLSDGFEKTTATFTDIIKRLALIDEAQKKITELSGNIINLQEVLSDKRSRGAFGEVQLSALVRNVLPENAFALQYTFPTGKRVDCILFLPEPTGNVAIDAKFPLENYQRMMDVSLIEGERRLAERQFKQDILKHIQNIAEKYIIPGQTADGAVMFIPAEAVFAEIHARYPELVEASFKARVWLVSPTTMMAILTTARAVLKDAATRQQVHIIQEHLSYLSKDFKRFQERMNNLEKHIDQAHMDMKQVKTSADKISVRFGKIEKVELTNSVNTELASE
ncbi:MAG: hypothetical protein LEGION0398_MBIBDBAK_00093 [Legionellaceae bacterium]